MSSNMSMSLALASVTFNHVGELSALIRNCHVILPHYIQPCSQGTILILCPASLQDQPLHTTSNPVPGPLSYTMSSLSLRLPLHATSNPVPGPLSYTMSSLSPRPPLHATSKPVPGALS